ncbi:MAG: segregation and condensation protein A [Sumerlaeia bacterium]
MTYILPPHFALPVFEGPLDLLLHLVKVHEMDITDIEISVITAQYQAAIQDMQELQLDVAGDFLVMAATLINIKLRSLLPRDEQSEEFTPEEEIDEILSTQDLIRKLVEYRRFKELSAQLHDYELKNKGICYRSQALTYVPGSKTELPRQDIRLLYDAFSKVLRTVRQKPQHTVQKERFTVEEKLNHLRKTISLGQTVNMARIFERCTIKEEVISYFLAILEMSKLREITIAQAGSFEDILIAPWNEQMSDAG